MKKTTVSFLGIVLLLFAFSVPSVFAQVECNNDADCDDGLFCTGIESCSSEGSVCISSGDPCVGAVCDEASDTCVECLNDDNCTEGVCVDNVCVECRDNTNCEDDNDPCNGMEECTDGICVSSGNPCPDGQICQPLMIPDVLTAPQADDYICIGCDNDTDCDDGIYCNGVEVCEEGTCMAGSPPCQGNEELPICDEQNQRCVECDNDTQCGDGVFCNGLETCNETSGECEEGEDPCEESLICDEENDVCTECLNDDDCRGGDNNTPYCDDELLSCVECLVSDDCENDNETCREGVCEVAACELKIRPRKVRTGRMFRPIERRFKITSEDGYVPGQTITIDFGWLQPYVTKYEVTEKGKLKVWVRVPTGARLFKGPLEVIVNDCAAEVLFK